MDSLRDQQINKFYEDFKRSPEMFKRALRESGDEDRLIYLERTAGPNDLHLIDEYISILNKIRSLAGRLELSAFWG